MRRPFVFARSVGLGGFLGFQLFVGGTVISALLHPLLWLFLLASLRPEMIPWPDLVPPGFLYVNIGLLVVGYLGLILVGLAAILRRHYLVLVPFVLTMGFYWLLMSAAAYKAVYQLVVRPFYWEKTEHNLTSVTPVLRCELVAEVSRGGWIRRTGRRLFTGR